MIKIEKDGYIISQANNNHVVICKDGEMLFHAECTKKATKEQLLKVLDFYFKIMKGLDD